MGLSWFKHQNSIAGVFTCCLASIFLHASSIPLAETPFSQIWNPENVKKEDFTNEVDILKHSIPKIETPKYDASKAYVGNILAKTKLPTSLVQSSVSLVQEEKEAIPFKQGKTLPHLKVKQISLSNGPLNKKHFLDSELYPNFTPFGQIWLKDPLGTFPLYQEQMTTNDLINAPNWSVEDSLLAPFLTSSISRLHLELNVKSLYDESTSFKKDSQALLVANMDKQFSLMHADFPLNSSLDLNTFVQFSDTPLFHSLINHESEREFANALLQNRLTYDELDLSFETSRAWENNLIGLGLQILSNRETKALFNSKYEDPFTSSNFAETLIDLLSRKEVFSEALKTPPLTMTLFKDQNFLTFLSDADIDYKGLISFYKFKQQGIDSSLIQDDISAPLDFAPPVSREGPFGYIESISTYATNIEDDFIDVDPSFTAYKNKMHLFDCSHAWSDTSLLQSSSTNTILHCPLTLAGVYTDDFFLPISLVSKKSHIETIFLENMISAPHLLVPTKQGVLWVLIEDIVASLEAMDKIAQVSKTLVATTPDKITYHTTNCIYADIPTLFYTPNTTLTRKVQEIESPVSLLALFEDNSFYIRQPFAEKSNYKNSPTLNPHILLGNIELGTHLYSSGDLLFHQFVSNAEDSLQLDPFQSGNWIQWHSQSITTGEISNLAHSRQMTSSKIIALEIRSISTPRSETMRFDIGQFTSSIFKFTEFELSQNQITSLSILKSAQKEVVAAIKTSLSPLYANKASIPITKYNSPPQSNKVRSCNYISLYDNEDAFSFVRDVSYDQKGALLAYHANTDDSIPNSYYLLPQINLTRIAFLPLAGQEPKLLTSKPFSEQAVLKELARGKNQVNRFTHMDLCSLPSLEFLHTDSLSDEFNTVVRTLPLKNGKGAMFSILLSPFNKGSIDSAKNHIYFLLDRSSTMEEHRFHTFKKAISQSLTYLDEGTPFNIALFDFETEWLNEQDLPATKSSVNNIRKKLKTTAQRGKTSIQTFANIIEGLKEKAYRTGEPHTVILLSDGRFMKNIRIQRNTIKSITDNVPDTFSLYAASASDNNNLGMLNLVTGLCHGDAVHAKTHSAFTRKLAGLTKRVHNPLGYCVKVTQINKDNTTELLENSALSRNLYADKVYKIYGETSNRNDITLMIQAYNGDRWLNIPKKISFNNNVTSPSRLSADIAKEKSLLDFLHFLQSGNSASLERGQQRLISNHLPSPIR